MPTKILILFLFTISYLQAQKIDSIAVLSFKDGKPIILPSGKDSIQVLKYDFGKVGLGDSVHHQFWIKNKGKAPLIITNVVASCKCTVAYFSDGEIPAGEVGVVQTGFVIQEEGRNHHTLTILSNTPSGTDFIELYYEGLNIERKRKKTGIEN